MMKLVAGFLKDEAGATAIEYGLIGALISIAIVAGATSLGDAVKAKFSSVATKVTSATN